MERLIRIIETQQKGHEAEPRFMIGEQLKEIAARDPLAREILEKDLVTDGMKLEDAEDRFEEYAEKNHGKSKTFCITSQVAEDILREFYGLPKTEETAGEGNADTSEYIDISSFLV